jgi:hypothetical protein
MNTYDLLDARVTEFQRDWIAVLGFKAVDTSSVDGAQQVLVYLAVVHLRLVFATGKI